MNYSSKTAKSINLEVVVQTHKPISKAPSLADLERRSSGSEASLTRHIEDERERRYSAVDDSGQVWLIANPAVWVTEIDALGVTRLVRPRPILYSGVRKTRQTSIEEAF